jgi:DNA recombination-dependent growth factor C
MGFLKGGAVLSRYRLLEEPQEGLTEDFIGQRLKKNAFVDIEDSAQESSVGWVEILDHLSYTFEPHCFNFGSVFGFTLRVDERRLASKTLNRYYQIIEAKFLAQTGRKPNTLKKREMKETLKQDLLRRCLLNTTLFEVLWLRDSLEIWLGAAGDKSRSVFEDFWFKTFGLELRLLVPVTIGLEIMPEKLQKPLLNSQPVPMYHRHEEK